MKTSYKFNKNCKQLFNDKYDYNKFKSKITVTNELNIYQVDKYKNNYYINKIKEEDIEKEKKEIDEIINKTILNKEKHNLNIIKFKLEYKKIINFLKENLHKKNLLGKKIKFNDSLFSNYFSDVLTDNELIEITIMINNLININLSIFLYFKIKKFTSDFIFLKII